MLLFNYQEVCNILGYFRKITISLYKHIIFIFSLYEYQKDVGNLCHNYLTLQVMWKLKNEVDKAFMNAFSRAYILNLIGPNGIQM